MTLEPKVLEAALPPSYSMATPTNAAQLTEQSLQQRATALSIREAHIALRETQLRDAQPRSANPQDSAESDLHWSLFFAVLLWLAAWILACCFIGTHLHAKHCSDGLGLIAWIVCIAGLVAVCRVGAGLKLDEMQLGAAAGSWNRGFLVGVRYHLELLLLVPTIAIAVVIVPACQARD
ncbi:hypothetical protein B0A54_17707 [Friedmanniomyces endolithicus]|uniref:Uncharacterized protein n=1 Tax=Friedmanniomyces endolithicus TaxID=329885 RepID=A0A4U0TNZ4_9PEZI|nr:hypothetical protein LTS09_002914 [Friedmanniomyces endolithicus]TKA23730.1 hypothetical protein B0A54_17707 [Friedmanniomyces endolithicus]